MPRSRTSATLRRSVALPRKLVEQASRRAPPALRNNVNRLITVALQEYLRRRQERDFEEAMAKMASDPQIRAESRVILDEFTAAEKDGLK